MLIKRADENSKAPLLKNTSVTSQPQKGCERKKTVWWLASAIAGVLNVAAVATAYAACDYAAWREGGSYEAGDRAIYQGAVFRALVTHTAWTGTGWNPSVGSLWAVMSAANCDGQTNGEAKVASLPGPAKPFPQHMQYPGKIKPNHVSQTALDDTLKNYFNYWKKAYIRSSNGMTPGGGYYVNMKGTGGTGSEITTSEAHGYGMLIFALMSGYDTNAQRYFDGMYNMYDKHRSTLNHNLMSWLIDQSENTSKNSDSATDGDMDIAYALLLAHYQWGSSGAINYLSEAKRIINKGLKGDDVNLSSKRTMLGDWDDDAWSSRASDWMTGHMHVYYKATGDAFWNEAADTVYRLMSSITTNYSPNTGLMPDFIVGSTPKPAPANFLEADTDDDYSWNSCRYPLRIAMDAAHFGDSRATSAMTKVVNWVENSSGGDPSGIVAGYRLNGSAMAGYSNMAFTAPFIAAATVASGDHQTFVNKGWELMAGSKDGYYGDTISLMSMLFVSGNWWAPDGSKGGS